jgi:hypothetical protein
MILVLNKRDRDRLERTQTGLVKKMLQTLPNLSIWFGFWLFYGYIGRSGSGLFLI